MIAFYSGLVLPLLLRKACTAQGASLGAQLQIFFFDGQALRLMADIDGDVIQLIERGAGRSAIIKARYKDSPTGRSFEWRDGKFEEVR